MYDKQNLDENHFGMVISADLVVSDSKGEEKALLSVSL